MDYDFEDVILANEDILWKGQPKRGVINSFDMTFLAFALAMLLTGFYLLFRELKYSDQFLVGSASFIIFAGIAMIFSRMLWKNYKDKNTFYCITNKRVLIVMKLRLKNVLAIDLGEIDNYDEYFRRDGIGTIYIDVGGADLMDAYHYYRPDGSEMASTNIFTNTILKNIADPDLAYDTLIDAVNAFKEGLSEV